MKKRIFIITILSIAMLTACNESGKTNDISKNGQDKKQAEKLEIKECISIINDENKAVSVVVK